jgi:putative ABC transport system permease protein
MNLRENIGLAINSLKNNKLRSVLTMLGIIIGIGSVIAIASVGAAISRSISQSLQDIVGKSIEVYVSSRDTDANMQPTSDDLITQDMLNAFKAKFTGRIQDAGVYTSGGNGKLNDLRRSKVSLSGANGGYLRFRSVKLVSGRSFSDDDIDNARPVALMSASQALKTFGHANPIGQHVTVTGDKNVSDLRIIGIYKNSKSEQSPFTNNMADSGDTLYIPTTTAASITGTAASYSEMIVTVKSDANTERLSKDIRHWFNERYYANNSSFHVETYNIEKEANEVNREMNTLSTGIALIAGVSLLVGGIGVMNIMLVSVTERTREIGIRKALGASNADIRLQFIIEAIIICIIGGFIGIAVGGSLGALGGLFLDIKIYPTLSSIIVAVLFSMGIGIFFGAYPAGKAAKLNPIDALRYE